MARVTAALALTLAAPAAPATPPNRAIVGIFAQNMTQAIDAGVVNLAVLGDVPSLVRSWREHRVPGLYSGPAGGLSLSSGVWNYTTQLQPGWERALEASVAPVRPHLGTAIRGVLLGDEICCRNVACVNDTLVPVSNKLRALLGPDALLWTNECYGLFYPPSVQVPPALDLISVDRYASYTPGSSGASSPPPLQFAS